MIGDRKRMKKKENEDDEEEEKVCAFHFLLCEFIDLVSFWTANANLGLRWRDKKAKKMTQSGKTTQFYWR